MSAQLQVLEETCRALLRMRGEASSTSLAQQVARRYGMLDEGERAQFFTFLLDEFSPDHSTIAEAIATYQAEPDAATAQALGFATEAPRQPLLRAVNAAPGGIHCLLTMRTDCLEAASHDPSLVPVEQDIAYLLQHWFNRGFLTLERIDWQTPAAVLEKLIEYEAVHEIRGWDDLQRRLEHDRRCYGFFHPSLPGEPLIFVQVALTDRLHGSIHDVLDAPVPGATVETAPTAAIFYSISNCQPGLQGVPLGNFLIKRVTDELHADVESLRLYATLSPIPGYVTWVEKTGGGLDDDVAAAITAGGASVDPALCEQALASCARYLRDAKRAGEPRDPVARFHLRNGARLERINWAGDTSSKGIRESYGMLVNYVYDPSELADNHEAYMNEYRVRHSEAVAQLADIGVADST